MSADAAAQQVLKGDAPKEEPGFQKASREIAGSSWLITVLAFIAAMLLGGLLIIVTNEAVQDASKYFFARPADTFKAAWDIFSGAYSALFRGSVYNFDAETFSKGIKPLGETLRFSAPLIAAGLGVAVAFRVGLFNIGGRGQILMAAAGAGWIGATLHLPWYVHLPLAVIGGIAGGALWGGLVGFLKARTGAHEVILTIMLNYVAFYLVSWMLSTQGLLQAPGQVNEKTAAMQSSATFPNIFGNASKLHWGFVLVIAVTALVAWLMDRSSLGFKLRATGHNPRAAAVAGINVKAMYVIVMVISGGLMGLAGANQVLGTDKTGFSAGVDSGIGFDAITVALLGRSKPWGVFAAGILFGGLKAGSYAMQATRGVQVPIDIVLVIQSLIVLFIAAPPLVRSIFRLPDPAKVKAVAATAKAAA